MPSRNIVSYLKEHKVNYKTITHPPAYTAQEIAASAHIPGRALLKTVVIRVNGKLAILVEPANCKVNLAAVKKLLNTENVELAHEYEFEDAFPECETGAMPPIGELFDIDVYVDDVIRHEEDIAFNAGNHSELIKMRYADFEKLVKPKHMCLH